MDGYLGDEDVTLASGYDITGNNSRAYGKNNSATKEDVDIIEDGILLDGGEPDSFAGEEDELDTTEIGEDLFADDFDDEDLD